MSYYRPDIHPLRRVVSVKFTQSPYTKPGQGCLWHKLECGHEVTTKTSAKSATRKRCRECPPAHPGAFVLHKKPGEVNDDKKGQA